MLTPEQERVVEQVKTLWPSLTSIERMEWAVKLKPWFSGHLARTVFALSGRPQP